MINNEINVNSTQYSKLSKEDKYILVMKKLKKLFEIDGKYLVTVVHDNKKETVPYECIGIYNDLCIRERNLQKAIKNNLSNIKERTSTFDNDIKAYVESTIEGSCHKKDDKKVIVDDSINEFANNEQEESQSVITTNNASLHHHNNFKTKKKKQKVRMKKENTIKGKFQNNNRKSFKEILLFPFVSLKKHDYKGKYIKNKKKEGNRKGKFQNNNRKSFKEILLLPFTSLEKHNTNGKYLKNKEKESKHSNSIENDKYKKKRIKVALCAIALSAVTLIGSFLPNFGKKRANTSDDVSIKHNDTLNNKYDYNNEDENIILHPAEKEEKIDEQEENKRTEISLGDTVFIEDNSNIYTNSYDATNETNSYSPLYEGDYDREVLGVVYELDGNVYTIYKYEENANQRVEELINSNAKLTAVLVTRSDLLYTGNYEGYYNIDNIESVKVKTRIK